MQKELIHHLSSFISSERLKLFEKVLKYRISYLTVVLEDLYQPQNASAVLRTCDCFGIQNVHIIENRNKFTVDKEVALGASKWLSLYKYNRKKHNTTDAIKKLREEGYRIVATTPHFDDQYLPDFDITKGKVALIFGPELQGISDTIKNEADEFLKIPMVGFTESFNISVSAAIILYQLSERLRKLPEKVWQLTDKEKDEILLQWLRTSIKRSSLLEQWFLTERGGGGV